MNTSMLPLPARTLLGGLLLMISVLVLPARGKDALFPELAGWTQGDSATWGPDNLYMPINGAADLFLRYSFEEMRSMDYRNAEGDTVSVEAYRHATSLDAFGVYSQGRPVRERYLELGVQAYAEPDSLTVLAGRHYLELRASSDSSVCREAMLALGKRMAAALNEGAQFPALFARFPARGRKPCSEKYLARDVLGYAFLGRAYQVDYQLEGADASLFVMEAETEDATKAMVRAYLKELKQAEDTSLAAVRDFSDRYHGTVLLQCQGNRLLLCSGKAPVDARKNLLKTLVDSLSKAP